MTNAPDLSINDYRVREKGEYAYWKKIKGMSINETFIQLGDYGI